jgi:predicted CoA-binding protein
MTTTTLRTKDAARQFLAHRRIAVTGVSRSPKDHGANVVYRRLRDRGYDVVAVNPNADQVEGDQCWPDLTSVPGGVEAVVIGTRPEHAEATVRECVELGVSHVWMHRSVDAGSVSPDAAAFARMNGLTVIEGGCPCMFAPAADPAHRVMKTVLTLAGRVPRRV